MAADTLGLQLDSLPPPTSDVREEPLPSTVAVLDTPPDPASIPIHAPSGTPPPEPGTLLPDVEMAEAPAEPADAPPEPAPVPDDAPPHTNGVNGNGNVDHEMEDVSPSMSAPSLHSHVEPKAEPPVPSSVSFPGATTIDAATFHNLTNGNGTNGSNIRPHPDSLDDDGLPPAKRARKLSDPDSASLNHTNGFISPPPAPVAATPPAPAHPPASSSAVPQTLTTAQHRFMQSTIRTLKRMKEAVPFLHPVDPIALNIPHYPAIISHPMDLGTVERKIQASTPTKPEPNPPFGRYHNADEFIADVHLIFANCVKFNGPEHAVTGLGKRVEAVFDKQIKQMPANEEPKAAVKKQSPPLPPAPAPVPVKKAPVRRPSAAQPVAPPAPVARRSDQDLAGSSRPKRDVHPPPPKDLGYTELPKRTRPKKVKDDGTQEQLRFCAKLISEMYKKQHWQIASPFYEPVDWLKLDIPAYPKIIKKPMDLLTMKKKLDNREYSDALKFYADFKLMIRNCYTFNPAGTPVHSAGMALSTLFDEKWAQLPPLKEAQSDNDDEDDDSEDEDDSAINELTSQLESVKSNLAALQSRKKKKDGKQRKSSSQPKASGSGSKAYNGSGSSKKKGKNKVPDVDEVLSFDQKKELSETIQTLEGQKLERVIQIIHEGVPEIRDSTEEIELDIDQLPQAVLLKLYNTVMRPIKAKTAGRPSGTQRHSSHGGTGGLKRKSMDEEAEAERIRLLEERIRLFDKDPTAQVAGSGASSDSSDSDSSGSDSD
ncbi:Bromodomain-containing protein [Exidia glandulosa HHB12029]|uniref:Bromodomain-containing protein n=1 Tax=Exidia glandulosa HHB12029 TaxID=1314781 RepID=A0A165PBC5_EXIGL|nr:Bromodomain-containing protein [Exidia glandulosa HHB12029]